MSECAECGKTCKCPGCNCFSGLLHVSIEGEYLVRHGKIMRVLETDCRDRNTEFETWIVYTDPDEGAEE